MCEQARALTRSAATTSVQPFEIAVPNAAIEDLRSRLRATRWPDAVADVGWGYGTDPAYLRELCGYWADGFDWRAREAELNRLPHHKAIIDGIAVHFVRLGEGEGKPPLLLLHGWPDSFWRFLKLIPLLRDRYELIVPSLIGYGFSAGSTEKGMSVGRIAGLFDTLIARLGHERVAIRGGDMGAGVARMLALKHPQRVAALHLTGLFPSSFQPPEDATKEEQAYYGRLQQWQMMEGAYAMEQATKPHTLGPALNDSPAGLASWIVEKFHAWSDIGDGLETVYPRDDLLTNLSIYWFTQTAGSAARLYKESMGGQQGPFGKRVEVPTAFAQTPKDIVPGPRSIGERDYNVVRWTEFDRGGHFAEWEVPELIAADLIAFLDEQGYRG